MSGTVAFRATLNALLGGALLVIAASTYAQDPSTAPTAATHGPAAISAPDFNLEPPRQWSRIPERTTSTIGAPVDVSRLDTLRGGDDAPVSLIVVDGNVEGNSADRVISGNNSIAGGAFDNANGINTVIQNTGTNVLIQNAMVVNVHFADPAP